MNTNSRSSILKKIAGATALIAAVGFASQASAKLITVSEIGGWTGSDSANDYFTGGVPAGSPGTVVGTVANWFTNSTPPSTLTIDFLTDTIDVPNNGMASALVATISQNNQVIQEIDSAPPETFPYIHTLSFAANFTISDPDNGNAVLFSDNPTGTVRHTETLNQAPCGSLAAPGPDLSINAAGSTCDDIFSFDLTLNPIDQFMIGNVWYDAEFQIVPRAGIVIGADGRIYTPEGGQNFVDVFVKITGQTHVPEPGMLALLGLGLAGIAFSRRRTTRR